MVTVEDFSRLVSGVYAAAVTPQHWEATIREVHRTMGGLGGSLCMADGAIWSIQNTSMPEHAAKSYSEHFCRIDPVLAAVEKGPVGAVRTGNELVVPNRKSEFYTGWMRPNELEDGLFVRLTDGPRPTSFLVASSNRSESFDTPERVKLLSGLVPHLQQAVRTQAKLAALGQSTADLMGALEAVRHGTVIVGSGSWVINLNTAAERILRAEDGLQMCSARIAAASMQADHKLHRALCAALTDDGLKIRSSRSFVCERP